MSAHFASATVYKLHIKYKLRRRGFQTGDKTDRRVRTTASNTTKLRDHSVGFPLDPTKGFYAKKTCSNGSVYAHFQPEPLSPSLSCAYNY